MWASQSQVLACSYSSFHKIGDTPSNETPSFFLQQICQIFFSQSYHHKPNCGRCRKMLQKLRATMWLGTLTTTSPSWSYLYEVMHWRPELPTLWCCQVRHCPRSWMPTCWSDSCITTSNVVPGQNHSSFFNRCNKKLYSKKTVQYKY